MQLPSHIETQLIAHCKKKKYSEAQTKSVLDLVLTLATIGAELIIENAKMKKAA